MKIFMYLVLLITAVNCGSSHQSENTTALATPEPVEQQNDLFVGKISMSDLSISPHSAWFESMYKSYEPNLESLQLIQQNIHDYEILMFMGTWCADSQREVPKFYKLLEKSNFNMEHLQIMAVREDKTLPDNRQKEFNVVYVPTMIFLKDGREVGRFVEYSQEEFEDDIAKIVSGQEYRHSYQY